MALISRIQHWQKIRTRFDALIVKNEGLNLQLANNCRDSDPSLGSLRSHQSITWVSDTQRSTVEQLGNVLLHGLAERFVHLGGLK